jgi:hypothetical protein
MKVLIGCEYSATVRDAFDRRGCDAWSCDILPSEVPGKHLQKFIEDAILYDGPWDLIILHLPCTAIALCGNSTYGRGMKKNEERITAVAWTKFVWNLANKVCNWVVFENPKNVMGRHIGKHSQVIHPYEYGHPEQKETWLWLRGVPPLVATNNVYDEMMKLPKKKRERLHYMSPSKSRGKERARFFVGWAEAMAEQWGSLGKGGSPKA